MSIWNDPEISFEEFSKYLCDNNNVASLQKIWTKKTKNKELVSELENHELSQILVLFQKECILSYNKNNKSNKISLDLLQDSSHLFSDWIFENKLSGIPSSDDEDYNKMKLLDIFNNNMLFNWITESVQPLHTYINSKNEHDPSLSQQEIANKNKRIVNKHPSLAHLFQQKLVNKKQNQFNEYKKKQKEKQNEKYNAKYENANEKIHHLRKSRAMLFFNYSDIGYETKKRCNIYKDEKLTQFLIQVSKGELFGGKAEDKNNEIIHIIEPVQGYIHSKYVKVFDLNSAQWKFLQHQRSMTSVGSQSLTLRINNEELFLPANEESEENEFDNSNKKAKVQFKPYNENEDEKKLEEKNDKHNAMANTSNVSLRDKRITTSKDTAKRILNMNKSSRKAKDVVNLWISGFNLHDLDILRECYSPKVSSQQFVNQELQARDPILQCLKQMFNASDDIGIDLKNMIIKQGNVILEFTTFGSKKEDADNNSNTSNTSDNLLGSHPTKSGLPSKIINGVGIFNVSTGEITNQRLFWDQDQQWFSDMDVIKMPASSSISHFLYKNKLAPILNLRNQHLDNNGSNHNSTDKNSSDEKINHNILRNDMMNNNNETLNGDNNIIYEMNDEMNERLALLGLNISDLKQYENKKQNNYKQKQMAQAIFWLAVGAMFVFFVPKYLGKPKR